MTKLFDISKINPNDPLRESKIWAFDNIKKYTHSLRQSKSKSYLPLEIDSIVLEQNLWRVIEEYKLHFKNEDIRLQRSGANSDAHFSENWPEKVINASRKGEIVNIKKVIENAVDRLGGLLTQELKKMVDATWGTVWVRNDLENSKEVGAFIEFTRAEDSRVLRQKLAKFDARFPSGVNEGDWEKETARQILRDELLDRISRSEQVERGEKSFHNERLELIMNNLRGAEFFCDNKGKIKITCPSVYHDYTIEEFRNRMKGVSMIGSEYLKEEWLPTGQKKADLLSKVEEVIASGIKEVEKEIEDNYSEISSIFNEYEDDEAKNDKQKLDNQKEDPKLIETWKEQNISAITKFLNKEPVVKEEDLEAENRNWLEQIKATDSWNEINNISQRVWNNITSKREIKQQTANLDTILEETIDARNFASHFQTAQRSLGESEIQVKVERAKKKLIENDPELYFDTFNQWVEKEEEALVLEAKNKELAAELETISELEYNEEEEQFLAGQITDRQKQEEIAQQIEEKLNVKKKTWKLWKWLEEKAKWVQAKARALKNRNKVGFEKKVEEIRKEINNVENSSNLHERKAFKHSKNKAEALLRELESITNENINTTSNVHKFGWVVGIGAALLIVTLVIRQRKKKLSK